MNSGTPGQKECESQGSWTPATPFRPIQPKPMPIHANGQANQPDQPNWQGSECFSSVCNKDSQSNTAVIHFNSTNSEDTNRGVNNAEVSSATKMGVACDTVEACREVSIDPLAEYKNVPFASLLALANAASQRNENTAADEVSISHQHSYDLNSHPGTMPDKSSLPIISKFAPITPDKAIGVKSKRISEIENLCSYDRTNQEKDEQNNDIAAKRVVSSGILGNEEHLELLTDASVSAVSTQIKENHNPEGVADLNKTPQQKPKRKKHRPKVAKEGKPKIPKNSKDNATGKRKYVRKKGLNNGLTSAPAEAAGESTNLKTNELAIESRRKASNFDIGLTRDEKSACKSTFDSVSVSQEEFCQSKSTRQLCKETEVMTPNPVITKINGSKQTPTGKRKYVRKGIGTEKPSPQDAAAPTDMKMFEPTKEFCGTMDSGMQEQPRDENFKCKSSFDLVSESQAKDLFMSTGQLGKGDAVTKPVTPQPNHSKEPATGKRKYVRKKGLNKDSKSTPTEVAGVSNDQKKLKPAKRSCRRSLNFDIEGQPRYENSSKSILQLGEGIEVIVENTQGCIAYDLTCSVNRPIKEYIASPEGQKQTSDSRKEIITDGIGQRTADNGEGNSKQVILQTDGQSSPRNLIGSKCGTCTIAIEQGQAWEPKRRNSDAIRQADASSSNLTGVHYLTLQAYKVPEPHFPNIYKKRRSDKGQNSATSSTSSCVTAAKSILLDTCSEGDVRADSNVSDQEKQKTLENTLALSPVERQKRKRSRGPARVRDLASLTRIAECVMQQTYHGSRGPLDSDKQHVGNSQRPQTCIEALVSEMHETLARKKRTKRNSLVSSISSNSNEAQKHQKIINNHHQFSSNLLGILPELTWRQMFSVDAIVEQLKHLNINKESSEDQEQNAIVPFYMNHEQNALVLYSRDGTIVSFQDSFDLVKKRRPRPKVELDEETNRVWKLLMQDINSEGIDGTDEEKARQWEEERRVFHGRVDSFIARMHLVQGDRRFSMWKGSVVDSVVGVFLTQNVSDHLSSSAFMSLAANFPLDSKQKPCHGEEITSVIEEPAEYVLDPEDTIEWKEKMSHQPVCDQGSMTLHGSESSEEREVVSSNNSLESSTSVVSSINESKCKLMNSSEIYPETYNDVLSSQNSLDSSFAPIADGTISSSNSNSDAGDSSNVPTLNSFNGSNSFVELLQMVGSTMLHGNYNHRNGHMSSDENSKDEHSQFQTLESNNQRVKVKDIDDPKVLSRVSSIPPSSFHPCLTQDLSVEVESYEMRREETRSSGISDVTDKIALMPEFASQTTDATKLIVAGPEAPRHGNKQSRNSMQANKNSIAQHESELFGDSRFAMEPPAHAQKNDLNLPKISSGSIDAIESHNALYNRENTQLKSSVSDQNKYDHSFSKELNGIDDATSKSKSTRVSKEKQNDFDWDSLRRQVEANGGKKERPEHTKDSLDWEAVRCADVNKIANTIKERGMNNMLAGRIKDFLNRLVSDHGSVDLEWLRDVPPDKAKYPVLESIQKYLWPRLCKLDQRTLYELHYQMITFGKVFCTKSKPNCNACPMRGECRHFASAFASSRLALPGPEEKAIVSANENRTNTQNPAMMINQLPLPLTHATDLPVGKLEIAVNNCEPIIEEPATPEPERVQVSENDIEDTFCEDPEEIPTIKLNMKEFTQTLQNYMQENLELQEGDMSKALVALTAGAASIPAPKLKNVSRLRTEHQVYELPDSHPLLRGMEKREPDDPGRYLLAIWTPGETANSIQPPESRCSSQEHGKMCDEKTCFSCNSVRESEFQIVRGTILIPCRTAMRGSFPLNGTYFQVNEVFADHDSSLKPINVPREWLWNLPRRTVYFGTSIPSIFKGLTTEGIQHCFWRGYVCVRGFDQKSRAPRPLMARLHFPASKLNKVPGKADADHK
ncbi:protein ROS1 isoform X2 [Citrus clementina]|uniref:protein ROS1 isoform X2 n=1 Tax=Citrus clementina TaxID=85681 RepID=UPI000CED2CBA|nr:protein ROS1 isoform X2 [Citrus x clementina]